MLKITRLQVDAHSVALVLKNGQLELVLGAGKHWIGYNREVQKYDMTRPFHPIVDLDVLLQNEDLAEMLEIVSVKDNEIAIQYRNGVFYQVLKPGRYVYWKAYLKYTHELINLDEIEISTNISKRVLHLPSVIQYIRVLAVESFEAALLYIDGQLVRSLNPGVYYFWKGEKNVLLLKTDLRTQHMEINGQELLTKDKASIRINLATTFKVIDADKVLIHTNNASSQLYSLMQLGLRAYVGQYSLDELLANKSAASPYIMEFAKEKADELGYQILTTGIKDIILPGDVKEIMNQVLVAEKKAQANVIMRREETASTRSLLNTAKLMQDNDMLYKLKEMEYVEKIADNIQNISLQGGGHIVDQLKNIFSGSAK